LKDPGGALVDPGCACALDLGVACVVGLDYACEMGLDSACEVGPGSACEVDLGFACGAHLGFACGSHLGAACGAHLDFADLEGDPGAACEGCFAVGAFVVVGCWPIAVATAPDPKVPAWAACVGQPVAQEEVVLQVEQLVVAVVREL
jgi:hypothetical protein